MLYRLSYGLKKAATIGVGPAWVNLARRVPFVVASSRHSPVRSIS